MKMLCYSLPEDWKFYEAFTRFNQILFYLFKYSFFSTCSLYLCVFHYTINPSKNRSSNRGIWLTVWEWKRPETFGTGCRLCPCSPGPNAGAVGQATSHWDKGVPRETPSSAARTEVTEAAIRRRRLGTAGPGGGRTRRWPPDGCSATPRFS